jgi:alkanesulfonate monooxygenase SsuD/methylene tetrahydromethanopterin reductase-like flavin-dependent oxidoreductase (luciferase family)
LWVAATSEETHGMAGRMGLGLLSFTLLVSTEHLGRRIAAYRDGLKEAKPLGQFVNPRAAVFFMTHCAATDKQAREEAERAFLSYAQTTLATAIKVPADGGSGQQRYAHAQFEAADPTKITIDYLIDNDMCIVGSPDTCIKQIERMQSILNMDQLLCMMQFWPIPHQKTMNSIKLFGKYVIPYFSPV